MLNIESYWIYSCTDDPRELISIISFGKKIARDRKSIARLLRLYLSWGYYMETTNPRFTQPQAFAFFQAPPFLIAWFPFTSHFRWWIPNTPCTHCYLMVKSPIWIHLMLYYLYSLIWWFDSNMSTCPLIFPCIFPSSRYSNARVSILNPS